MGRCRCDCAGRPGVEVVKDTSSRRNAERTHIRWMENDRTPSGCRSSKDKRAHARAAESISGRDRLVKRIRAARRAIANVDPARAAAGAAAVFRAAPGGRRQLQAAACATAAALTASSSIRRLLPRRAGHCSLDWWKRHRTGRTSSTACPWTAARNWILHILAPRRRPRPARAHSRHRGSRRAMAR